MSEWISVKDRLPEKEGTYLIFVLKRIEIVEYKKIPSSDPARSEKKWQHNMDYTITHWMPLPCPPKD